MGSKYDQYIKYYFTCVLFINFGSYDRLCDFDDVALPKLGGVFFSDHMQKLCCFCCVILLSVN